MPEQVSASSFLLSVYGISFSVVYGPKGCIHSACSGLYVVRGDALPIMNGDSRVAREGAIFLEVHRLYNRSLFLMI